MKEISIGILSFAVGGLAVFFLTPTSPEPVGAEVLNTQVRAKRELMKEHIWLNERLKQTPTIDLSIGTVEEWQQAAIDVAEEKEISTEEILSAGSVNAALRSKAAELSRLCNNPNSTATREELEADKTFVRP